MTTENRTHDVVVIGARCAGAATARLLALQGYDVVLLDRSEPGSDTLSTHGLARGGVVQLARWGLLDDVLATGAPAVREVTFVTGGPDGSVLTRPVKDRAGVDLLLAPRRDVLDTLLAEHARRAGAELRFGVEVTGLLSDGTDGTGRVTGVELRGGEQVRGRYVVGADGLRSRTAGWVDAPVEDAFASEATLFYTYVDGVDWRGYEFHIGQQSFAGAFPTHGGAANVWLSRPHAAYASVLRGGDRLGAWLGLLDEQAPHLADRVRAGRVVAPLRGCLRPANFLRRPWGPGWALVGDAGYHRDPITGHGMTDAFRDAELLADALADALHDPAGEREALAGYQATRDEVVADTFRLTRALAAYPEPDRFVELQVELAGALDREATWLASRPAPAGALTAA